MLDKLQSRKTICSSIFLMERPYYSLNHFHGKPYLISTLPSLPAIGPADGEKQLSNHINVMRKES